MDTVEEQLAEDPDAFVADVFASLMLVRDAGWGAPPESIGHATNWREADLVHRSVGAICGGRVR
jgi:hypothetical protein